VQTVLACVLQTALRLLHPVMPFESEELWRLLHETLGLAAPSLLIRAAWPEVQRGFCAPALLELVHAKYELISLGRMLRSEYNVPPGAKVRFAVKPAADELARFLAGESDTMARLLQASEITVDPAFTAAHPLPGQMTKTATIFMFLDGAFDLKAEAQRMTKQLGEVEGYIAAQQRKLANGKFTSSAPATVVEKEQAKLAEAQERAAKLRQMLAFFAGGAA